MKNTVLLFSVLITFIGIAQAQQKEFSWLQGTWKQNGKNAYEIWRLDDNGKSLRGFSFFVKDGDTTVTEQIQLVYKDKAFHYVPVVDGQGAVDFKIKEYTNASFVAENPLHDFPKVIRYRFFKNANRDYIEATIEGNGKTMSYSFERVK
jgi:hypothetical protein